MADKVIYQDGDDLSETNLALMLAVGNQTDYKERGFGFSPDFTNNTLTVGTTDTWGNFAIIDDSKKAFYLLADQRTGLSLSSSATNYVYLHHDPSQDDHIAFEINTTQTPPSNPSLLIGTVDTANDTFDDTVNDSPDGSFESLGADDASIGRLIAALDGNGQDITGVGAFGAQQATVGGRSLLTKDDNGSIDDSGSSVSVSLDGSYGIIKITISNLTANSGGSTTVTAGLRVNGVSSSSYNTIRLSGAVSNDRWEFGQIHEFGGGRMQGEITIIHSGGYNYGIYGGVAAPSTTDPIISGSMNDGSTDSPISSIEFISPNGVDVAAEVTGR